MHRMAQGVARRVFIKERSSTCHHVSDRALSLHPLTSSSLSSVSTLCPFSSSPLSWSSSSMCSEPPSTRTLAHTQNEEYCSVAVQNPLTVTGTPSYRHLQSQVPTAHALSDLPWGDLVMATTASRSRSSRCVFHQEPLSCLFSRSSPNVSQCSQPTEAHHLT